MASGRINITSLTSKIENKLSETFGSLENGLHWINYSIDFNFFINREILNLKKISLIEVEEQIKNVMLTEDGFAHVFTQNDYQIHRLPPGIHERQILKTYFNGRSGDVIGIPKPFFVHDDENSTTHMTGYSYDRTVPLILTGSYFKKKIIAKTIDIIDLAPTLTFLTGTIPPSSSEGKILTEALKE